MKTIIPKHGKGKLTMYEKGETGNRKGRPKQPLKLKEFIKMMETEDDEIIMSVDQVEFFTKDGEEFVKFKNFKAGKLFASLLQHSMKGNMKALDILIKLGFAGGYEPVKSEVDTKVTEYKFQTNLNDKDD